jgi:hypothetical protein
LGRSNHVVGRRLWIKALSLELSEIIEIEWMELGWSLMEDGGWRKEK